MANLLDRLIHENERVALFIDGANLYSAARGVQFDIDYKKLLEEFRKRGRLIRAYYYTALLEDQDFSPIRPLVDWLDYNGYTLVTKPAREYTDAQGRRRIKGDMDVEIAVDMMEAAHFADHVFLFSGDGDFLALVEALQRKGVRVSVISTIRSNPPMASDDLRRQADNFIDLTELAQVIGRPPRERPPAERPPAERYEDEEEDV
ncbi:MAG: NYN domain-containing protein [Hyphomonadaceae bacterium]|nr:NYN domain-containing protein [Hyphomonadaceae bacterium]